MASEHQAWRTTLMNGGLVGSSNCAGVLLHCFVLFAISFCIGLGMHLEQYHLLA